MQRAVSRALSPLWVPLLIGVMRLVLGWRIEDAAAVRREYARLRRTSTAPLLVCANHLTMLDSFVVAWAIGGVGFYLRDFAAMPWNTPERTLFAARGWQRVLVWLFKCVPIERGTDRAEIARTLAKIRFLLEGREAVLIFPEGGRSRSGRVEVDAAAHGVGRLVTSLPGCRVFCVYLRGRGQASFSDAPRRGERFDVSASVIEPKSDRRGVRGSVDVSRQIVGRLAELEREVLDDRE